MYSIPNDLVLEIFLRLPSKSIERFRFLSKLWSSLLHRPYFTELFLTRSLARPRLLFAIEQNGECCLISSPQLQSSLVVAADFHTKVPGPTCSYESGLICLSDWFGHNFAPMICNPKTGQYVILPEQRFPRSSYIGFDPIDKQFKVLSIANRYSEARDDHRILTLGTGQLRWRKIQCPLPHVSWYGSICINGVLYYLAEQNGTYHSMACFDIRSEKFKFIDGDYRESFPHFYSHLVNYKGKLGLIFWRSDDEEDANELRLWVLEDVEKQVWSKYVYTLPKIQVCDPLCVYVAGVTAMGQIVLSMFHYIPKEPFYVFYFNPEDKTLHTVEIQGFKVDCSAGVRTYLEHVEDLNASDAKLFRSSICEEQNHYIGKR